MRGSLKGVRSRVERLAAQVVRDGCYVCREDEAQTRLFWVNERDEEPELKATCTACGRTYEREYTRLSWRTRPTTRATAAVCRRRRRVT